jgi:hypothetical protein
MDLLKNPVEDGCSSSVVSFPAGEDAYMFTRNTNWKQVECVFTN